VRWAIAPLAVLAQIAPVDDASVTPEQRVAPGTSRVVAVDGGWALRLGRSQTGLECATVGQTVGWQFGLVGLDRTFRALPEANADACGEAGSLFGARVFSGRGTRDVRTVVNGVAGADAGRITLALAGRRPRLLPHSPEGAFAFVVRGYPEDVAPVITVERRGGATRRYAFGSGQTVPDPLGGAAWTTRSVAGHYDLEARTHIGCVHFQTAREGRLRSPEVCGVDTHRADVKLKPLYFRTAVVHGRVALWGAVRGRGDLRVRAGAFRATVDERRAGAFVVFLPRGTDPRTVTVEIQGRRYPSTFGTRPQPKDVR